MQRQPATIALSSHIIRSRSSSSASAAPASSSSAAAAREELSGHARVRLVSRPPLPIKEEEPIVRGVIGRP